MLLNECSYSAKPGHVLKLIQFSLASKWVLWTQCVFPTLEGTMNWGSSGRGRGYLAWFSVPSSDCPYIQVCSHRHFQRAVSLGTHCSVTYFLLGLRSTLGLTMASPPLGRSALTDLSFCAKSCCCWSGRRDFRVDNVQWSPLKVLCPLDSSLEAQSLKRSGSSKLICSLTISI